jgi:hypothetical protein
MMFNVDWDTQAFDKAIAEMPTRLDARLLSACRATGLSLQREMKARLQRQLSPAATGATVAGILAELSYDKHAYVVRTQDVKSETERAGERLAFEQRLIRDRRRLAATFRKEKHVGLYLEKGTKPGRRKNFARTAPRPFFYASATLEAPNHEQRVVEAIDGAAADAGLKD